MFIGHFALALGAKKIAPKTSLGTLMLSTGLVDVLWPFFLFFGWEHVRIAPGDTAVTPLDFYDYPISHSLVADIGWAIAFGAGYFLFRHYRRGAIVVALGVLSHWFLDFVSHRADMPVLIVGGPFLGLGLWNSVATTMAVETIMYAAGIAIYLKATRAKDRIGSLGFAIFFAVMYLFYLGNILGPPPPSVTAIAAFGPLSLVLFAFPYWIDRHRTVR
jgi:hypothetical protein